MVMKHYILYILYIPELSIYLFTGSPEYTKQTHCEAIASRQPGKLLVRLLKSTSHLLGMVIQGAQ